MSGYVRPTDEGVARIVAALGQSTFYGITVQGHCMGIVARTWRDPVTAAGYGYAVDGARAVIAAGRMRGGDPPTGALYWFDTSNGAMAEPGHVVTIDRPGSTIGNVSSTIQRRALAAWSFRRLGWCWPADVPGWGPVRPEPGDDDVVTDQDVARIAAAVWDQQVKSMWTGQTMSARTALAQAGFYAISGAVPGTVPAGATSGGGSRTAQQVVLDAIAAD